MTPKRCSLDQARWFVLHRKTGQYLDYGFASKSAAMQEVAFLNTKEQQEGRTPDYCVSPSAPKRPPELHVLKGGKS